MKRGTARLFTSGFLLATTFWGALLSIGTAANELMGQSPSAMPATRATQPAPDVLLEPTAPAAVGTPVSSPSTSTTATVLPRGLEKFVELARAGVAVETQIAFVESTAVAYKLSTDDIVRLQRLGVASEVISALIRHGKVVREQMQEEWKARQAYSADPVASAQSVSSYASALEYRYATPQPVYEPSPVVSMPVSQPAYSYPSQGFLVIGTSHHTSSHRGAYPFVAYPGSYVSYPGYYSPALNVARPLACVPAVRPAYINSRFHFRY